MKRSLPRSSGEVKPVVATTRRRHLRFRAEPVGISFLLGPFRQDEDVKFSKDSDSDIPILIAAKPE